MTHFLFCFALKAWPQLQGQHGRYCAPSELQGRRAIQSGGPCEPVRWRSSIRLLEDLPLQASRSHRHGEGSVVSPVRRSGSSQEIAMLSRCGHARATSYATGCPGPCTGQQGLQRGGCELCQHQSCAHSGQLHDGNEWLRRSDRAAALQVNAGAGSCVDDGTCERRQLIRNGPHLL